MPVFDVVCSRGEELVFLDGMGEHVRTRFDLGEANVSALRRGEECRNGDDLHETQYRAQRCLQSIVSN